MKVNKIFIVSVILLAILSLGAVNAADDIAANELAVDDAGNFDLEVPAGDEITADGDGLDDVAVGENEILGVSSDEKLSSTAVIVVNSSNYMNYFNQSNEGKLVDSIEPGTTLDIQGSIINSNASETILMEINKPVNVISTTADGYICLNTTRVTSNAFSVTVGGSGSNITGISFYNTWILITNASHIVLDKVSIVNDQAIASGSTFIRYNSSFITFKNSYLYANKNTGAAFTLCWAYNCTIDNNTFVSGPNMGSYNLIYYFVPAGQFGIKPTDNTINVYNKFTNNLVCGENGIMPRFSSTPGGNNIFENNTFLNTAVSFNSLVNSTFIGNVFTAGKQGGSLVGGTDSIHINNYIEGGLTTGQNSIAYGNTVLNAMVVSKGAEAYNNTVGGLTLSGADAKVHNNIVNGSTTITAANSQIYDNTFIGDYTIKFNNANAKNITFDGNYVIGNIQFANKNAKDNKIINNTITTSSEYAIDLQSFTGTGNNISDNILYSKNGFGNDAVNNADPELILDNYQNISAEISIVANNIKVGETAVINITSNETSLTGADILVNGKKYTITLSEGKGYLELKDLSSGNYNVSVISNDLTYGSQNSTSFEVNKNDSPILVDAPAKTQWIDSNITVTITGATGDVTLDINGSEFTSELVDGVAIFVVPDFAYGNYDFNITYDGDYKFLGNATNGTLTVNRNKEVKIIASDIVEYKLVDEFVAKFINFIGEGIADANVTITIGDAVYPLVTDGNGTVIADLALTRGKYDVNVAFKAIEGEYDAASADYNITVIDGSIIKIVSVDAQGLVTGSLYDALGAPIANAIVVASMNETATNLTTNNTGLFEFQAEDGCKVTFVFAGDEITTESDASITVNIKPTPKDTSIINIVAVDGTGLITGSLTVLGNPIANAVIVASMNDTEVTLVTDEDGLFQFQAQNGFEATFKYTGDLNTTDANASITLNNMVPIPKDTSIIKVVSVDGTGLIVGSLTVLGNPIANATVVVTANGVDVNLTTDEAGLFQFQAMNGFETVFMYAGDDTTTSSDVAITLNNMVPIPKDTSIIKVMSVDGSGLIVGSLTVLGNPIANATVVVTANGVDVNLTTDEAGLFQFQAMNGFETVFMYAGDDTTTSSDVAITLNNMVPIPKDTSIIKVVSVDGDGLITGSLTVLDTPIANAVVVATVNGVDTSLTTDANGIFKFQAQNGKEVVFKYAGDDTTTSSDASFTLTNVAHIVKDSLINASDVSVVAVDTGAGEKGKTYTLALKDTEDKALANKTVQVTLNGEVYTVNTDENGSANVALSLSAAKTYNLNVFYMGDDDYKGTTAAVKVTVTKKTTTLKAAKTKYTFKATAKSKVIKATLKTSNKYLKAGKKVTIKIKGKTYTAKTGKNGAIKLNVKALNKKGTYKAKIKFAGDSTYKASSSKTIKIVIK